MYSVKSTIESSKPQKGRICHLESKWQSLVVETDGHLRGREAQGVHGHGVEHPRSLDVHLVVEAGGGGVRGVEQYRVFAQQQAELFAERVVLVHVVLELALGNEAVDVAQEVERQRGECQFGEAEARLDDLHVQVEALLGVVRVAQQVGHAIHAEEHRRADLQRLAQLLQLGLKPPESEHTFLRSLKGWLPFQRRSCAPS